MNKEILIIGGGVAGLSAAIHAIQHGYRPIILEKNRYFGGRVRSFYADDLQQTIDNGQHVLSAAYKETIALLKITGALSKINFQKNFNTHFIKDVGQRFNFRTLALPTPFHFIIPIILNNKFTQISFFDYLKFLRKNVGIKEDDLQKMTVTEWLTHCNQDSTILDILWKPLTLAILNTPIEQASAYLLKKAIQNSFFHSRKNARLGIPGDWLGNMFAQPAQKYILANGGSLYPSTMVTKLIAADGHIEAIVTKKQQFDTPHVICTLPPYSLFSILKESRIAQLQSLANTINKFDYNTIITINIFLKKPINSIFPIAPIFSPIQWIFPHPDNATSSDKYGYALVISAAKKWVNKSHDEIIAMVKSELLHLLGIDLNHSHALLQYKIIKEKRATIAQTPDSLPLRSSTQTQLENLFLAGDWINTELPATIESAVLSGRWAVEAMLNTSI